MAQILLFCPVGSSISYLCSVGVSNIQQKLPLDDVSVCESLAAVSVYCRTRPGADVAAWRLCNARPACSGARLGLHTHTLSHNVDHWFS